MIRYRQCMRLIAVESLLVPLFVICTKFNFINTVAEYYFIIPFFSTPPPPKQLPGFGGMYT